MESLEKLKSQITIVIVGHHLKAISGADKLVVMNEGRITEEGIHSKLVQSNEIYNILFLQGKYKND
jgi:ABC-type transport system involved in Fe-S cluster assembly fused permease/ATPase subunit